MAATPLPKLAVADAQAGPGPAQGMDDSPRGRLLRAAAHLFVERGFDRTTVRDLAAEIGIQSGSIFHHFRRKTDILEAVMVEVIELNTARMVAARDAESDPVQRLRALLRCELQSINGDTSEAMTLLVAEWRALDADAQARVLILRDRYERLFLDAIENACDALVDVDPFIMRRFLYGIDAATRYWFNPDGALSIDALVDEMMKLLLRGEGGRR